MEGTNFGEHDFGSFMAAQLRGARRGAGLLHVIDEWRNELLGGSQPCCDVVGGRDRRVQRPPPSRGLGVGDEVTFDIVSRDSWVWATDVARVHVDLGAAVVVAGPATASPPAESTGAVDTSAAEATMNAARVDAVRRSRAEAVAQRAFRAAHVAAGAQRVSRVAHAANVPVSALTDGSVDVSRVNHEVSPLAGAYAPDGDITDGHPWLYVPKAPFSHGIPVYVCTGGA